MGLGFPTSTSTTTIINNIAPCPVQMSMANSPRGRGSIECAFGEHIPRHGREGKHGRRRRETANVDDATRHRHTHYSYTLAKQLTARVTSGWLGPAAATTYQP